MSEDVILDWTTNIESGEIPTVAQPDVADLDHAKERQSVADEVGYPKLYRTNSSGKALTRGLVFNSVAYRWLVACLIQKLTLEVVNGNLDVRSRIHQDIYDVFEHSRYVGEQKASERCQMYFATDWNPTEFLTEQFGSQCDIGRLLGESLTLTGTATDAQILPCSEYLSQTWPTTGPKFLELLKKALVSGEVASGMLANQVNIHVATVVDVS